MSWKGKLNMNKIYLSDDQQVSIDELVENAEEMIEVDVSEVDTP